MKNPKENSKLFFIGLRETYWITLIGFERIALDQIRVLDLEVHNYDKRK